MSNRRMTEGRQCIALILCSLALPAWAATLTVGNDSDAVASNGSLSLREALLSMQMGSDVNADATAARTGAYGAADQIAFAIGSGVRVIAVNTPLPVVAYPLNINGLSQPGAEAAPRIVIDGSAATATTVGWVLAPGNELAGIAVQDFGADGIQVLPVLFTHGFESGGAAIALPDAPVKILDSRISNNGGDGLRVSLSTRVELQNTVVADNLGQGMTIEGELRANLFTVNGNDGDGVLVESDAVVRLIQGQITANGNDSGDVGVRVLRASRNDGLTELGALERNGLRIEQSTIANHLGDGISVGDPARQSGRAIVRIFDNSIHDNEVGMRVQQRDAAALSSVVGIRGNNVYNNRGPGIRLSTHFQLPRTLPPLPDDVRETLPPFIANQVHHNAITSADCQGLQSNAQVVVDSPAAIEPAHAAACGAIGIDTEIECARLADAEDVLSNNVSTACVWTGSSCVAAWDLGARPNTSECLDTSNRIFAYVNDPGQPAATQKGLAAFNGALIRARVNTWGVGGADNGTFADATSQIDYEDTCATFATCP